MSDTPITINEASRRLPTKLSGGDIEIELSNDDHENVDVDKLYERLRSIEGREAVRTLVIAATSHLTDLRVLELFAGIEFLQIHGLRLQSLEGIQHLGNEVVVEMDTGQNKRRKIDALAESRVAKMTLHRAVETDFQTLARAKHLEELAVTRAPGVPTRSRWVSPLRTLALHAGTFSELRDLSQIPELRDLLLAGCAKLERITGANEGIDSLILSSCKKLVPSSLTSMSRLRVLAASRCRISVRTLTELEFLEDLTLDDCAIDSDVPLVALARLARLKRIAVSGMRKQVLELSAAIPRVLVLSDGVEYLGGIGKEGS
jgi:hypothetical protein